MEDEIVVKIYGYEGASENTAASRQMSRDVQVLNDEVRPYSEDPRVAELKSRFKEILNKEGFKPEDNKQLIAILNELVKVTGSDPLLKDQYAEALQNLQVITVRYLVSTGQDEVGSYIRDNASNLAHAFENKRYDTRLWIVDELLSALKNAVGNKDQKLIDAALSGISACGESFPELVNKQVSSLHSDIVIRGNSLGSQKKAQYIRAAQLAVGAYDADNELVESIAATKTGMDEELAKQDPEGELASVLRLHQLSLDEVSYWKAENERVLKESGGDTQKYMDKMGQVLKGDRELFETYKKIDNLNKALIKIKESIWKALDGDDAEKLKDALDEFRNYKEAFVLLGLMTKEETADYEWLLSGGITPGKAPAPKEKKEKVILVVRTLEDQKPGQAAEDVKSNYYVVIKENGKFRRATSAEVAELVKDGTIDDLSFRLLQRYEVKQGIQLHHVQKDQEFENAANKVRNDNAEYREKMSWANIGMRVLYNTLGNNKRTSLAYVRILDSMIGTEWKEAVFTGREKRKALIDKMNAAIEEQYNADVRDRLKKDPEHAKYDELENKFTAFWLDILKANGIDQSSLKTLTGKDLESLKDPELRCEIASLFVRSLSKEDAELWHAYNDKRNDYLLKHSKNRQKLVQETNLKIKKELQGEPDVMGHEVNYSDESDHVLSDLVNSIRAISASGIDEKGLAIVPDMLSRLGADPWVRRYVVNTLELLLRSGKGDIRKAIEDIYDQAMTERLLMGEAKIGPGEGNQIVQVIKLDRSSVERLGAARANAQVNTKGPEPDKDLIPVSTSFNPASYARKAPLSALKTLMMSAGSTEVSGVTPRRKKTVDGKTVTEYYVPSNLMNGKDLMLLVGLLGQAKYSLHYTPNTQAEISTLSKYLNDDAVKKLPEDQRLTAKKLVEWIDNPGIYITAEDVANIPKIIKDAAMAKLLSGSAWLVFPGLSKDEISQLKSLSSVLGERAISTIDSENNPYYSGHELAFKALSRISGQLGSAFVLNMGEEKKGLLHKLKEEFVFSTIPVSDLRMQPGTNDLLIQFIKAKYVFRNMGPTESVLKQRKPLVERSVVLQKKIAEVLERKLAPYTFEEKSRVLEELKKNDPEIKALVKELKELKVKLDSLQASVSKYWMDTINSSIDLEFIKAVEGYDGFKRDTTPEMVQSMMMQEVHETNQELLSKAKKGLEACGGRYFTLFVIPGEPQAVSDGKIAMQKLLKRLNTDYVSKGDVATVALGLFNRYAQRLITPIRYIAGGVATSTDGTDVHTGGVDYETAIEDPGSFMPWLVMLNGVFRTSDETKEDLTLLAKTIIVGGDNIVPYGAMLERELDALIKLFRQEQKYLSDPKNAHTAERLKKQRGTMPSLEKLIDYLETHKKELVGKRILVGAKQDETDPSYMLFCLIKQYFTYESIRADAVPSKRDPVDYILSFDPVRTLNIEPGEKMETVVYYPSGDPVIASEAFSLNTAKNIPHSEYLPFLPEYDVFGAGRTFASAMAKELSQYSFDPGSELINQRLLGEHSVEFLSGFGKTAFSWAMIPFQISVGMYSNLTSLMTGGGEGKFVEGATPFIIQMASFLLWELGKSPLHMTLDSMRAPGVSPFESLGSIAATSAFLYSAFSFCNRAIGGPLGPGFELTAVYRLSKTLSRAMRVGWSAAFKTGFNNMLLNEMAYQSLSQWVFSPFVKPFKQSTLYNSFKGGSSPYHSLVVNNIAKVAGRTTGLVRETFTNPYDVAYRGLRTVEPFTSLSKAVNEVSIFVNGNYYPRADKVTGVLVEMPDGRSLTLNELMSAASKKKTAGLAQMVAQNSTFEFIYQEEGLAQGGPEKREASLKASAKDLPDLLIRQGYDSRKMENFTKLEAAIETLVRGKDLIETGRGYSNKKVTKMTLSEAETIVSRTFGSERFEAIRAGNEAAISGSREIAESLRNWAYRNRSTMMFTLRFATKHNALLNFMHNPLVNTVSFGARAAKAGVRIVAAKVAEKRAASSSGLPANAEPAVARGGTSRVTLKDADGPTAVNEMKKVITSEQVAQRVTDWLRSEKGRTFLASEKGKAFIKGLDARAAELKVGRGKALLANGGEMLFGLAVMMGASAFLSEFGINDPLVHQIFPLAVGYLASLGSGPLWVKAVYGEKAYIIDRVKLISENPTKFGRTVASLNKFFKGMGELTILTKLLDPALASLGVENQLVRGLGSMAAGMTVMKLSGSIVSRSLGSAVLKNLIVKLGLKGATKAIPIVGWASFGMDLIDLAMSTEYSRSVEERVYEMNQKDRGWLASSAAWVGNTLFTSAARSQEINATEKGRERLLEVLRSDQKSVVSERELVLKEIASYLSAGGKMADLSTELEFVMMPTQRKEHNPMGGRVAMINMNVSEETVFRAIAEKYIAEGKNRTEQQIMDDIAKQFFITHQQVSDVLKKGSVIMIQARMSSILSVDPTRWNTPKYQYGYLDGCRDFRDMFNGNGTLKRESQVEFIKYLYSKYGK